MSGKSIATSSSGIGLLFCSRKQPPQRMRERVADVAKLPRGNTFVYLCGLKGMETGVLEALRQACLSAGLDWPSLHQRLVDEGRFHVETYWRPLLTARLSRGTH